MQSGRAKRVIFSFTSCRGYSREATVINARCAHLKQHDTTNISFSIYTDDFLFFSLSLSRLHFSSTHISDRHLCRNQCDRVGNQLRKPNAGVEMVHEKNNHFFIFGVMQAGGCGVCVRTSVFKFVL